MSISYDCTGRLRSYAYYVGQSLALHNDCVGCGKDDTDLHVTRTKLTLCASALLAEIGLQVRHADLISVASRKIF